MLITFFNFGVGFCLGIVSIISRDMVDAIDYTLKTDNILSEQPLFFHNKSDIIDICFNKDENLTNVLGLNFNDQSFAILNTLLSLHKSLKSLQNEEKNKVIDTLLKKYDKYRNIYKLLIGKGPML